MELDNSRLSGHVIAILAAEEADQARHVVRHARAAQQDQVLGVLLDRLAFLGAFLLAELFVDEIPHRLSRSGVSMSTYFLALDVDVHSPSRQSLGRTH